MIPMWPLYNVSSINDIVFDINLSEYIKRGYNLKKRKDIYESLVWANDNPNYNFVDIMQDAPSVRKIKFKKDEIYRHLLNFKSFMENEEFGLLTDDTSTSFPWEKKED